MGLFDDVPWAGRSRQEEGRVTERKILKKMGARIHPNSGAGPIKDDGSDDDHVYEIKDANKTYTLKGAELEATRIRAVRQGKEAVWKVYFHSEDITAIIVIEKGMT